MNRQTPAKLANRKFKILTSPFGNLGEAENFLTNFNRGGGGCAPLDNTKATSFVNGPRAVPSTGIDPIHLLIVSIESLRVDKIFETNLNCGTRTFA